MGLGVNIMARPLGYIELKEGEARFVPIADVTKIAVGGMLVAGLALLTMNRFMSFKAIRKRQKMAWKRMQAMQGQ